MRIIITLIILLFSLTTESYSADQQKLRYGIGTDALTYFFEGYSFIGSYVFGKYEVYLGYSNTRVPEWYLSDSIERADESITLLGIKYNFGEGVRSYFVSIGINYSTIKERIEDFSEIIEWYNTSLYFSVGYNIALTERFRLIPWLGIGYSINGDTKKVVNNRVVYISTESYGYGLELFYYF